jgi:hypothetical protein
MGSGARIATGGPSGNGNGITASSSAAIGLTRASGTREPVSASINDHTSSWSSAVAASLDLEAATRRVRARARQKAKDQHTTSNKGDRDRRDRDRDHDHDRDRNRDRERDRDRSHGNNGNNSSTPTSSEPEPKRGRRRFKKKRRKPSIKDEPRASPSTHELYDPVDSHRDSRLGISSVSRNAFPSTPTRYDREPSLDRGISTGSQLGGGASSLKSPAARSRSRTPDHLASGMSNAGGSLPMGSSNGPSSVVGNSSSSHHRVGSVISNNASGTNSPSGISSLMTRVRTRDPLSPNAPPPLLPITSSTAMNLSHSPHGGSASGSFTPGGAGTSSGLASAGRAIAR